MKISKISIRNFRSFANASFDVHDYTLLVGANNSGKSTLVHALRIFYEQTKYNSDDWPKVTADGEECWIEITYVLSEGEVVDLPEKYRRETKELKVRKYLKSDSKVKSSQSNIYAYLPDETMESSLFFGAKNIGQAKLGSVVYIPALSVPSDNLKTSGPSPLRDIITHVFKKMVAASPAYAKVQSAFEELSVEAKSDAGTLNDLISPMNSAIADWGIQLQLDMRAFTADDFVKNLIQHSFSDQNLAETPLPLDRFGQGFQRSVIFELIRLAPNFTDRPAAPTKKEFDPDFTLILFEEPEAFLHPDQQVTMSLNLRKMAKEPSQQVVLTTHSPIFVGKSAHDLTSIVRVSKHEGVSSTHQLSRDKLADVLGEGRRLADVLRTYVENPSTPPENRKKAECFLKETPSEDLAFAEEQFRYQIWLDSDRANLFFAGKVVVCEGPSERVLFNYLLENQWDDLRLGRISVIDATGKFNIHRYLALLDAFAIPHAVVMDGDKNGAYHEVVNNLIETMCGPHALTKPFRFEEDVERFLGLPKSTASRSDRKPVAILHALATGQIEASALTKLKLEFMKACALPKLDAV